jgi:hypothetical protein
MLSRWLAGVCKTFWSETLLFYLRNSASNRKERRCISSGERIIGAFEWNFQKPSGNCVRKFAIDRWSISVGAHWLDSH